MIWPVMTAVFQDVSSFKQQYKGIEVSAVFRIEVKE